MNLFKLTNNQLEEIETDEFNLERDIQSLFEKNLENLFNLKFVKSEFTIGKYRIDTLAFNEENNSFVIIEYKKGSSYSVIDQGFTYLSLMVNNKADFILELNENTNINIKRDDIDWSQSKIIFISPSFNTYQKDSINFGDIRFELWEIKKYKNNLIGLEQQKPSSKESLKKFENTNKKISQVNNEIIVLEESDHTKKCSEKILQLWEEVKDTINNIDNYEYNVTKGYISIKKNKTVSYVHFNKNILGFDFVRGNIYAKGKKSKDFFTFDDPKEIAQEKIVNWTSGDKRHYYHVEINSKDQIEYLIWLFKQKSKSIN